MSSLELLGVEKSYDGKHKVLQGISLKVNPGEFIVLVGPSGCGKSTLLRMIAGLEDISAGEVKIANQRVNEKPPADRDIAMVFQDYALYPHMSVRENLSFGLKIRKTPQSEIQARVEKTARMLSLSGLLDRKPAALSGGQRQRVAIGRAIVRNPSLFLFDEPLSNLDAQLRAQTRIELASLHQQLGNTVVYVTHDQVEALTLATRIVVLEKGRIQQVGSPLELYHRPANRFVASFIGNPGMNFFEGNLTFRGSDEATFQCGELILTFTRNLVPSQPGAFVLGVRPEAIKILAKEGRESQGHPDFLPEVILLEPHGHEMHLVAKVGSQQIIIRSANPKRLAVMEKAKKGETLPATLDRTALHWFEFNEAGQRVA
jgi:multiple sugar transport system ATP-binding protein